MQLCTYDYVNLHVHVRIPFALYVIRSSTIRGLRLQCVHVHVYYRPPPTHTAVERHVYNSTRTPLSD